MSKRRLASLGRIVAMVVLLAALASSATALPGANNVDKNDLKKNVVKSKNVKNGSLTEADHVAEEQLHLVGAPGQPAFNNGGEGDCVWQGGNSVAPSLMPVGFRIDRFGIVHMSGIAVAAEVAGAGDEECGATPPEPDDSAEDFIAFTLPPEYRPEKAVAFAAGDSTILIAGNEPVVGTGLTVPAGAVFVTVPTFGAALDMVSYPATSADVLAKVAPGTSGPARARGSLPGILRELGF